jgi:hypothetical protein
MAEKKQSFPMLPGAHWWALRANFKQSIPGVVTDSYLAATLNMKPRSARVNVLPYLEDVGLIDKDGKTEELAKTWRDDQQYAEVCKQMREKVYPEELRLAAPNPKEDRTPAERWFAHRTGAGSSAVGKMVQFYTILTEADVTKKKQDAPAERTSSTRREAQAPRKRRTGEVSTTTPEGTGETADTKRNVDGHSDLSRFPGVSINLQIHISSDASPDQIDKIFESMGRHIYQK